MGKSKVFTKSNDEKTNIECKLGDHAFLNFIDAVGDKLKNNKNSLVSNIYDKLSEFLERPPTAERLTLENIDQQFDNPHALKISFNELLKDLSQCLDKIPDEVPVFFMETADILVNAAYYMADERNHFFGVFEDTNWTKDSAALSSVYYTLFYMLNELFKRITSPEYTSINLEEINLICEAIEAGIDKLLNDDYKDKNEGNRNDFLKSIKNSLLPNIQVYAHYKNEKEHFSTTANDVARKVEATTSEANMLLFDISQGNENIATIENSNADEVLKMTGNEVAVKAMLEYQAKADADVILTAVDNARQKAEEKKKRGTTTSPMYIHGGQSASPNEEIYDEISQSLKNTYREDTVSVTDFTYKKVNKQDKSSEEDKGSNFNTDTDVDTNEILNELQFEQNDAKRDRIDLTKQKGVGYTTEISKKEIKIKKVAINKMSIELYKIFLEKELNKRGLYGGEIFNRAINDCTNQFIERNDKSNNDYLKIFGNNIQYQQQKEDEYIKIIKLQNALEESLKSIDLITKQYGALWWSKNYKNYLDTTLDFIEAAAKEVSNFYSTNFVSDSANGPYINNIRSKIKNIKDNFPSKKISEFRVKARDIQANDQELNTALNNFFNSSNKLADLLGKKDERIKSQDIPNSIAYVDQDQLQKDIQSIQELCQANQLIIAKARLLTEKIEKTNIELHDTVLKQEIIISAQKNTIEEINTKFNKTNDLLVSANSKLETVTKDLEERNESEKIFIDSLLNRLRSTAETFDSEQEKVKNIREKINNAKELLNSEKDSESIDGESQTLQKTFDDPVDYASKIMSEASELLGSYSTLMKNYENILKDLTTYAQDKFQSDKDLMDKLSSVKDKLTEAQETMSVLRNEIAYLRGQLNAISAENIRLKNQLSEQQDKLGKLQEDNKKLQSQLLTQSKNISQTQKHHLDPEKLVSENKELQNQVRQLNEQTDNLKKENDDAKETIKNYKIQKSSLEDVIETLKSEKKQLEETSSSNSNQLLKVQQQLQTAQEKLTTLKQGQGSKQPPSSIIKTDHSTKTRSPSQALIDLRNKCQIQIDELNKELQGCFVPFEDRKQTKKAVLRKIIDLIDSWDKHNIEEGNIYKEAVDFVRTEKFQNKQTIADIRSTVEAGIFSQFCSNRTYNLLYEYTKSINKGGVNLDMNF
ncbi:hypothetical protein L3V82_07385 [Thiotrichales bacterium 19S3-7]|nr:hypothetical protein [Thiotrichales bacterium 19S3-7]MCF6801979.1 hypothetical protein [Thiotrichales bacterium 19S3-11]